MALFLLNYMKFRSGLNISPFNRNLCFAVLFFAADDKRFTSLDGLRLHINKVHLPKRLRCVECENATSSATHLQRHTKRQHDIAKLDVKRWKQEPHNGNSELVTKFSHYSSFWAQLFYKIYGSFPEVSQNLVHLYVFTLEITTFNRMFANVWFSCCLLWLSACHGFGPFVVPQRAINVFWLVLHWVSSIARTLTVTCRRPATFIPS